MHIDPRILKLGMKILLGFGTTLLIGALARTEYELNEKIDAYFESKKSQDDNPYLED